MWIKGLIEALVLLRKAFENMEFMHFTVKFNKFIYFTAQFNHFTVNQVYGSKTRR